MNENCPFCGASNFKYYSGWAFGDRDKDSAIGRSPSITCECGIGFHLGYYGRGISDEDVKKEVFEAWNNRSE